MQGYQPPQPPNLGFGDKPALSAAEGAARGDGERSQQKLFFRLSCSMKTRGQRPQVAFLW